MDSHSDRFISMHNDYLEPPDEDDEVCCVDCGLVRDTCAGRPGRREGLMSKELTPQELDALRSWQPETPEGRAGRDYMDDLFDHIAAQQSTIERLRGALANRETVRFIDATPDESYPIRILKAYRDACDEVWTDNSAGREPSNPVCRLMAEAQKRRAAILDKALARARAALADVPQEGAEGMCAEMSWFDRQDAREQRDRQMAQQSLRAAIDKVVSTALSWDEALDCQPQEGAEDDDD